MCIFPPEETFKNNNNNRYLQKIYIRNDFLMMRHQTVLKYINLYFCIKKNNTHLCFNRLRLVATLFYCIYTAFPKRNLCMSMCSKFIVK